MAQVRYRCTACGKYGHRRNTCPEWSDGEKDGPRFLDKAKNAVKVQDEMWLLEQEAVRAKIQRECDTILRLEELVGHETLENESKAAGREYERFGVADVASDEVRPLRITKATEAVIERMKRGEI